MKNQQQKYENDSLLKEIKNIVNSRMDKMNNKLEMIIEQQQQDRIFMKQQIDRLLHVVQRSSGYPEKQQMKEETMKLHNYVNGDRYQKQKDGLNVLQDYGLDNKDISRQNISYNEPRLSFETKPIKQEIKDDRLNFNQSYNMYQPSNREIDKSYMNHSTNNFYTTNYEIDNKLKQNYIQPFSNKNTKVNTNTSSQFRKEKEKEDLFRSRTNGRRSHNTSYEKNNSIMKVRESHSNVKKKVMFADQNKQTSNDYIQQKRQQIEDQIEQRLKDGKHFQRKTIQQEQGSHFGRDIDYQKQQIYQKLK